nr:hypothetical protein GCM10020092_049140 [Actinoplanes digitatis]
MTSLSESAAERLVADTAFAPGMPGFVGLAVDLLLDEPVPSADPGGTPGERRPLRHGFLTARSARIVTVSGPPSPGIESSAARMTEDLRMSLPLIGASAPDEAAGAAEPGTAGIRVGLEAGVDGAGPYGLGRRWQLAHAVAPVLAAAFANAPLRHGSADRLAQRPPGPAPRPAVRAARRRPAGRLDGTGAGLAQRRAHVPGVDPPRAGRPAGRRGPRPAPRGAAAAGRRPGTPGDRRRRPPARRRLAGAARGHRGAAGRRVRGRRGGARDPAAG